MMASGMAVGVGKAGCLCGAVNGGVMALGLLFGRTEQDGPTNPKSVKCLQLTNELHTWFKDNCGKNSQDRGTEYLSWSMRLQTRMATGFAFRKAYKKMSQK